MAGRLQDDDISETHEINVTPFIDVMLVLLIIFMVVAPLSTVDVPVELPVSAATPAAKPDKPLYVTLKADLSLAVGNDTCAVERASARRSMRKRAATATSACSCVPTRQCRMAS